MLHSFPRRRRVLVSGSRISSFLCRPELVSESPFCHPEMSLQSIHCLLDKTIKKRNGIVIWKRDFGV